MRRLRFLVLAALLTACRGAPAEPAATPASGYTADGRAPLAELHARYETLATKHGWSQELVHADPGDPTLSIRAWRTPTQGQALWLLAGIHGEEPAGPNAIARNLASLAALADAGVPIVVLPLCNPRGYRNNWRYPNTPARDWRHGGYSVGDAGSLLPDPADETRPRDPAPSGPEAQALTRFVLRLADAYPPRLVIDLHEDELSTAGGYIYSQGARPDDDRVGAAVLRRLQSSGIPIRASGRTRFGEPIEDGVIRRNDRGEPIRDGSIDELFAAPVLIVDGERRPGPAAATVIVVETPAFAGSRLELRVAAQGAVVRDLARLWSLSGALPTSR